jgi:putative FmdB family regulatory protein
MPLYDYDCAECGRRVEVIHGVHSPGPTHCPNCGGGPLRKAISAPAVHFKGSGWAKKERHAAVASASSKAGDTSRADDGDAKSADGDGKGSTAKDAATGEGAAKDATAAQSDGAARKSGRGDRDSERSVTSAKPAGAGTATKTT